MRLFEAIIEANHRASRGDSKAGLRPSEYGDSLPVVALTCVDPRLDRLFPEVLALPEDQFIWMRNTGNIITSSQSSTLCSLALASAVRKGREIAIIGHTDCLMRGMEVSVLLNLFKEQGVSRSQLPDNLSESFGIFASEQQNVIRAVNFVRNSPLIGAAIPVHGLMVNTETGYLEWVVNGYDALAQNSMKPSIGVQSSPIGGGLGAMESIGACNLETMKCPEDKIGGITVKGIVPETFQETIVMPPPPPVLPKTPPPIKKTPIVFPKSMKLS